ncbi:MAG: indole-3-glycerol phosphate synthase TrpC [Candidatus Omnitrophica bacterium]|nr:indole-3-glycerol phosphate synthase TrpC [Candidatus Omnitrophota bacterium]
MILSGIIEEKERLVAGKKAALSLEDLKRSLKAGSSSRIDFKSAVSGDGIALIAEIKKKSPSKGVIRKDLKPLEIARDYAAAGAKALSVLTDEKFFGGDIRLIKEIKKEVSLPVLEKDFIIDEYQIYEARAAGADAILLIADILTPDQLRRFKDAADGLGLASLCEVHTLEDLEKVSGIDADIIGINNRNLHDFKVDLETTPRLIRHVPGGKIIISESGIKTYKDVMYLKSLGVNAVLIGEAFLSAQDIISKVREVMGTK